MDVFLGSAGPFVLAMFPLVLLGGLIYSDWSSLRRAVLMLRTKPLGVGAKRGTFGHFVGTVDEDALYSTAAQLEPRG